MYTGRWLAGVMMGRHGAIRIKGEVGDLVRVCRNELAFD